jgi:hypothetical protein
MPNKRRRDYSKIGLSIEEAEQFLDTQSWCYIATQDFDKNLWNMPMPFIRVNSRVYVLDIANSIIINNLMNYNNACIVVDSGYSYDELVGVILQCRTNLIDDAKKLDEIYAMLKNKYSSLAKLDFTPRGFKIIEFEPKHELNKISWHFGKGHV